MFKIYKIAPETYVVAAEGVLSQGPEVWNDFKTEDAARDYRDFLKAVYKAGQKSVRAPILAALGL